MDSSGLLTWILAAVAGLQPSTKAAVISRSLLPSIHKSWVYANPRFVHRWYDAKDPGFSSLDYTHMGMLTHFTNGSLAAAWQGSPRFYEGSKTQGIYMAVSQGRSHQWSSPELVVKPAGGTPVWGPVLQTQGNETWLFYAQSRAPCWWWGEGGLHWACGGDIYVATSADSGRHWSDPKTVYSFDEDGGIGKMVSNKPAIGPQGEWLLPFWREMGGHDCTHSPAMHGKAGVLISEDKGHTWTKLEVELDEASPATWLIEASISSKAFQCIPCLSSKSPVFTLQGYHDPVSNCSGFLQFFRTQVGSVYMSTSSDGRIWSPAKSTTLPNPNSKVDSTALPDGSVLIAYNDDTESRSGLTLARTWDGGVSWEKVLVLEDDPLGSFSYPTIQYDPTEDEAKVIYTVAYPEVKMSWMDISSLARLLRRNFCRANRIFKQILGSSAILEARGACINAWGYDTYGMRLARINNVTTLNTRFHPYQLL